MKAHSNRLQFFLIGTEFFPTGGIQRVNRSLLVTFLEFAERVPATIHVFSYGDDDASLSADLRSNPFLRWHGCGRRRGAMAAGFAREALRIQPHGALFTHVSLLPLMRILRAASPRTRTGMLGHGIEVWKPLGRGARARLRQLDSIITPSRFTADQLITVNGVDRHKTRVIPHSLPPDWSTPPAIQPRSGRPAPQLLAVARLTPADVYKGVGQIVATMPLIVRAHPQAKLLVAGDGSDRPRLQEHARSLGILKNVTFLGEVSESRLHELYAESDLFVLPSQKEGFGLVFLEAMFHGLPVVAARAGGAVDVVEHNVTGLLVGGDDCSELAAVICRLLDDSAQRLRLARAAQARILSDFMFANFSKQWTGWLASLCPGPVYGALQSAFVGSADVSRLVA